jgi:adenylate cyclase class 2
LLEREIKLSFDSAEEAREAIAASGASLVRPRRLQQDTLFDTADASLRQQRCALRVRRDAGRTILTFKGPPHGGAMKLRDEHETAVADGEALQQVLAGLGFRPWFRYEKYREEYEAGPVTVALDETPVGTFVEIEGDEPGILAAAAALGRSPSDFILDSYRARFLARREQLGIRESHMVFGERHSA